MSTQFEPLLAGVQQAAAAKPPRPDVFTRLRESWRAQMADPKRAKKLKRAGMISGGVLALGLGIGLFLWLRPVPQPDYLNDPLDDVLNFTLLTDEFNNLPVGERLKLIGDLRKRLGSMSSGDSAMMAAFAAGIMGAAREQLEENASKLALDMMDQYAVKYARVPDEDKTKFLEDSYIDLVETLEAVGGVTRPKTREERLADAQRDAQRQEDRIRSRDRETTGEFAGRGFGFLAETVGQQSSVHQRGRLTGYMRDLGRHMRGEDVNTGKPK
jgi:hypothetical protein